MIRELARALYKPVRKGKLSIPIPEKYVYGELGTSIRNLELLRRHGYTVCHQSLNYIGMPSWHEALEEIEHHTHLNPTPKQQRRVEILQEAAKLVGSYGPRNLRNVEIRDISLFDEKKEKNDLHGQYTESHVWISSQILSRRFERALAIYLHELTHKYGDDRSTSFSYALTEVLERTAGAMLKWPDRFKEFKSRW